MEKSPLLAVRDLRTEFRTDAGILTAVNGISFDVYPGETLGIVGESGSGKSVTCLSLLGLVPSPPGKVVHGSALFDGKDLLSIDAASRRSIRGKDITMVFQDPMTFLNPFLRISVQLTEHLMHHSGLGKKEAEIRAAEMLGKVGISEPEKKLRMYPHQLSGGMRQRVLIAMALLPSPRLLFADEPTTALDVTVQAQILELLKEKKREMGLSLVLITHNLGIVAGLADRVAVMYAGNIVETGKTADLFREPLHPYTRGLLDSIPSMDQKKNEKLTGIPGNPPVPIGLGEACSFADRCLRASDACRKDRPPVVQRKDGGMAACFHPILAPGGKE